MGSHSAGQSGTQVRQQRRRRKDTAAWRRIERAVGNIILLLAFAVILAILSWGLAHMAEGSGRAALVKGGAGVQTVSQVVPTTVVAIFVFALGGIFIIAQIVVPSRGSRTTAVLLQDVRLRVVPSARPHAAGRRLASERSVW